MSEPHTNAAKTSRLAKQSTKVGLRINMRRKVLRMNTKCEEPIIVDGQQLENVKDLIYLESFVDTLAGTDKDTLTRIG